MGKQWRSEDAPITASVVAEASKIIGLDFTLAERDSMIDELVRARNNYTRMRTVPLPNQVAPALVFHPSPSRLNPASRQSTFKISQQQKVVLPANREELAFYSVTQLAELIRTRQISSEELTKFFLERLKKYNEKLLCVVTLTEERALAEARQADAEIKAGRYKGLLHGIPYGAKDLLAAKGYPTTWGSPIYKNQVIDQDAAVVQRLRQAGAVLVAKLSVGEFAWGDVWFGGTTRNPWNPNQGSSGSSAGSASAVAAGLLPFAIGTETLGSIVSPSTVCGTTGLRPTFGRVSRTGCMALAWSMDKIGPIARTVEDCAVVFQAIYGPDGTDPSVRNYPFTYDATQSIKGLRIGYVKSDFERNYPFKQHDSLALVKMREMGMELIPIELPNLPTRELSMIITCEGAAAFDELTRNNLDDQMVRQIKNAWPNVFRAGRFIPAVEYIQANRIRTLLMEQMEEIMKNVDVYIAPSWAGTNLTLTNLTGHPAVVVPNGFRNGTPVSITFTGKLYDEGTLLRVAKAYQDATNFHLQHPSL
ncbi:MAG: amidase [Cytophagales bacterium]|nr:amidase [Bernardetiaceae bacterium]MDW8204234.1 amidase [Cytophagales bacterium]